MAASSLPELAGAGSLPRCASQPAHAPGALPRHVAPPTAAAPAACEAPSHTRLPQIDGGRSEGAAGWCELPPLREAPLLPSRGGSRPTPVARRGCDMDLPYDAFGSEPRAPGSLGARTASGRLGLAQHEDARGVAPQDAEQLKRQVNRLTQLRHDRESYIQDLLAEVEAAQHRHDSELARRTSRCQREVSERLAQQRREHEQQVEDRSRAHAAALAKQALQHEVELEELRRGFRREAERQLAERLSEQAGRFEHCLAGLRELARELQRQAERHGAAGPGGGGAACAEPPPLGAEAQRRPAAGPCAAHPSGQPSAAEAGAEAAQAAGPQEPGGGLGRAAEEIERALLAACTHLKRAAHASQQATALPAGALEVPRSQAREPEADAERSTSPLKQACEHRVRSQALELARVAAELRRFQSAALRSWATTCASLRCERARQQRLAGQRAGMARGVQRAQSAVLLHSALGAWTALRAEARCKAVHERQRERDAKAWMAERRGIEEEARQCAEALRGRLRAQAHWAALAHRRGRLEAALFCWIAAVRDAHREANHRHRFLIAAADRDAELFRIRAEGRRTANELRKQRRAHGVAAIHASLDRRLQAVVHAWSAAARDAQREAIYQRQLDIAAAESAAGCAVLRMEGRRNALELRHQRRTQAFRWLDATLRHWRHAVLVAWAQAALLARGQPPRPRAPSAASRAAAQPRRSETPSRCAAVLDHLCHALAVTAAQRAHAVLSSWAAGVQVGAARRRRAAARAQGCEDGLCLRVLRAWRALPAARGAAGTPAGGARGLGDEARWPEEARPGRGRGAPEAQPDWT